MAADAGQTKRGSSAMTGKREAALRTPVYTQPGAATEALAKGFAD